MCIFIYLFILSGLSDSNASATIANARLGGIKDVDVYLFPCPLCNKSASEQVSEMGKTKKGMCALAMLFLEQVGWKHCAQMRFTYTRLYVMYKIQDGFFFSACGILSYAVNVEIFVVTIFRGLKISRR